MSVWINYIDRGNLSVAAPALRPELGLGPQEMGVLLSAFFWTYSLLQPVGGWLVDRFDVYRVYAIGFALWSLAVSAGGLAPGFTSLLITRLLLGAGESIAYPSYSRILTRMFPESKRGFANSLIDVGTKAGPALGTLLGGFAIQAWGWRPFFFWMGALSLVWLIPWLAGMPPTHARKGGARMVNAWSVLRLRKAWVSFAGLFCFNYAFFFLLTWLPSYLVSERKFSMQAMSIFGALPFCATAVASLIGGWWADRAIARGADPGSFRKRVAVTGLLIFAVMLLASSFAPNAPAMGCLVVAFIGMGLFTSCAWAITQTMAGHAAGTWTGWQNAVGNMGGVVAPIVTGWSVAATGSFLTAFVIASALLFASAMFYGVLLGPVRPQFPTEPALRSPSPSAARP